MGPEGSIGEINYFNQWQIAEALYISYLHSSIDFLKHDLACYPSVLTFGPWSLPTALRLSLAGGKVLHISNFKWRWKDQI